MSLRQILTRLLFRAAPVSATPVPSMSPARLATPFHVPTIITSQDAPDSLRVRSQSTRGKSYTVNLKHWTCSCPDGVMRAARHGYKSPLRACKHIRQLIDQGKFDVPPHFAALFESDFYNSIESIYQASIHERPVLFTTSRAAWVNVFAPVDFTAPDEYSMFGYSLAEQRWSYDRAPEHAEELYTILSSIPPTPSNDTAL